MPLMLHGHVSHQYEIKRIAASAKKKSSPVADGGEARGTGWEPGGIVGGSGTEDEEAGVLRGRKRERNANR